MSNGPVNEADLDWTDHERGDRTFRASRSVTPPAVATRCALYEVPPDKRPWPTHYHEGNEEALYVLSGSGTLRTREAGDLALEPDDYVALPAGEESAHEIEAGESELRLLMVSTMEEPDITVYPDREMVGLYAGSPPGGEQAPVAVRNPHRQERRGEHDSEDEPPRRPTSN